MASLNILGVGDEEPGNLLGLSPPLSDGTPRGVQQIPERDALAALYNNVTALIERPAVQGLLRPSWNPNNPVGTERVREEYLTNPDLDVVPGVKWGESWVSPQNAAGLNRAQAFGEGFAGSASPGKGLLGIRAYHGSPHSFDRFDTSRIGTGEGAQAYGHGLYFAEREGVAKSYRDELSPRTLPDMSGYNVPTETAERVAKGWFDYLKNAAPADHVAMAEYLRKQGSAVDTLGADILEGKLKQKTGSMYEVNIAANPEHMLHWDKPLSEQHPLVQEALKRTPYPPHDMRVSPREYLAELETNREGVSRIGDPAALAAQALREAGIPGIRYRDAGSRNAPKLTEADKQQLQAAIADKQRLIADPRQQRDIAMHQADLDLFQRRLSGAEDVSHNLVVFDDAAIEILRKYGIAGLMTGAAGVGAASQRDQ